MTKIIECEWCGELILEEDARIYQGEHVCHECYRDRLMDELWDEIGPYREPELASSYRAGDWGSGNSLTYGHENNYRCPTCDGEGVIEYKGEEFECPHCEGAGEWTEWW